MLCTVQVLAKAYDNPIPGFKTPTVGNLRLWEALPVAEFDLSAFNEGKYDKVSPACLSQASRECLTARWCQVPIRRQKTGDQFAGPHQDACSSDSF